MINEIKFLNKNRYLERDSIQKQKHSVLFWCLMLWNRKTKQFKLNVKCLANLFDFFLHLMETVKLTLFKFTSCCEDESTLITCSQLFNALSKCVFCVKITTEKINIPLRVLQTDRLYLYLVWNFKNITFSSSNCY